MVAPLIYTGIYSGVLVGLIVLAILIIVGRGWCGSPNDNKAIPDCDATKTTGTPPGCISRRDCCKGTWEKFYSSVPLTIFIFTIVALFVAFGFVYFGKNF
jgi:hypothetical protein